MEAGRGREDWGGRLVLCCGEGCAASGVPAAVSIAGGATLAVDGDAAAVKAAMRRGELDFVVNTLDEALRALKNEVRVRRPLERGADRGCGCVLREMVERGVLPDLLLIGAKQNAQAIVQNESIRALQAAGMDLRSMVDADGERLGRPGMMLSAQDTTRLIFPLQTLPSCERWMSGCWRFSRPTIWFADVGCSALRSICAMREADGGCG